MSKIKIYIPILFLLYFGFGLQAEPTDYVAYYPFNGNANEEHTNANLESTKETTNVNAFSLEAKPKSAVINMVTKAGEFITTWKTTGANSSITIPTSGTGYNYTVDWGDGTTTSGYTGVAKHTYATTGTYTVKITGDFPRIYFNNVGDRDKIISIEQWGNISWKNMSSAFRGCLNLELNATDVPDLSLVTDMSLMFLNAKLFNGDLSNWNVSSVTNMSNMFSDAAAFNGDLSNWNVSSVTNMAAMFASAVAFNRDLSNWDVSTVTSMGSMFNGATAFNGDISKWNVSSVTSMARMFSEAAAFNGDLSNWNVSSATSMERMFIGAVAFNRDLSNWDVSSVINMSDMFSFATAFNGDISKWDVSSVISMSYMFSFTAVFDGDISNWDVSSVTSMSEMFRDTNAFNGDISKWDVSSVTKMFSMFSGARAFNGDISNWDVSSVTYMRSMFTFTAVFNGDISNWDVSSVTDMGGMFFSGAFNGDISNWDVSSVTDMGGMFFRGLFNGDISKWDVSSVTNMQQMFRETNAFNGDISNWDVSSVTDMRAMFSSARAFNKNLSTWDISSVTNMREMLHNSGLSAVNYDNTLLGWSSLGTSETQIPSSITLGAAGLNYCIGEDARNTLINSKSWTITGDQKECSEYYSIIAFSLATQTKSAVINTAAHTVNIEVVYGTDVTALMPTFTLSTGATAKVGTIVQESGITANDYTSPVTYTITAEDGTTTQDWVVTATVAANTATDVTAFSFGEQTKAATINTTNNTVAIEVAHGANVTALVSTFTLSTGAIAKVGATAQESGITANDFTSLVTYTITAQDGTTTQDWMVTATIAPNTATDVTTFSFGEQTNDAIINTTNGTVAIEVAHGTNVTSLVSTFMLSTGANAKVGATVQVSGTTTNDYGSPVTYTITAEDGMTTQDWVVTVTINAILAIEDEPQVQINMYPNPVSYMLNIETEQVLMGKVSMFNIKGVKVLDYDLKPNNNQIKVALLPQGIYILTVQDESTAIIKKQTILIND